MADSTFHAMLIHEVEVQRPSVGLDAEGAPKTPVYATQTADAACRLAPASAVSRDDLLGRDEEATHVVYLEPMDLRSGDRLCVRPVRTELAAKAERDDAVLVVGDTTGLWVGMEVEIGPAGEAELAHVVSATGTALTITPALAADHDAGQPVCQIRRYEVLTVEDAAGAGHHLKATIRELW